MNEITANPWPLGRIRDERPTVHVRFGAAVRECRISGFLNQFATVWAIGDHCLSADFRWTTIQRALSGGIVLEA